MILTFLSNSFSDVVLSAWSCSCWIEGCQIVGFFATGKDVAGADDLFEGTPSFCIKNNFEISWCCLMGGISESEIVLLHLFQPYLSEFLEDHHRKEVQGVYLILLKCGGSFDSVQVLFSPFDKSKYPHFPYLRKVLCQHNFL